MPLCLYLFIGRRRPRLQALRLAVAPVALAEVRVFVRIASIVIEGRTPEHRAMSHHAHADFADFLYVTTRRSASLIGDTKIARIHEANVLRAFLQPIGVHANRGSAVIEFDFSRQHVRFVLGVLIFFAVRHRALRDLNFVVTTMTIDARDMDCVGRMHARAVRLGVTTHASLRCVRRPTPACCLQAGETRRDGWSCLGAAACTPSKERDAISIAAANHRLSVRSLIMKLPRLYVDSNRPRIGIQGWNRT